MKKNLSRYSDYDLDRSFFGRVKYDPTGRLYGEWLFFEFLDFDWPRHMRIIIGDFEVFCSPAVI